jgi:hypothetical protein
LRLQNNTVVAVVSNKGCSIVRINGVEYVEHDISSWYRDGFFDSTAAVFDVGQKHRQIGGITTMKIHEPAQGKLAKMVCKHQNDITVAAICDSIAIIITIITITNTTIVNVNIITYTTIPTTAATAIITAMASIVVAAIIAVIAKWAEVWLVQVPVAQKLGRGAAAAAEVRAYARPTPVCIALHPT